MPDLFQQLLLWGGQVNWRDLFYQVSSSQATLHDNTTAANNWATGITSNYRSYNPANSKYKNVAATRASVIDPQKSFSNISGTGRYNTWTHWYANSAAVNDGGNRISYLTSSGSRPTTYFWGQDAYYSNTASAVFANHATNGLNFYRLSDNNKVVLDQFMNDNRHWLYYNNSYLDNNLLTISNTGVISKIESSTDYLDSTSNQATPLLFQTHGGVGANSGGAMVADYSRDSYWNSINAEQYIIYRPNFGSNTQLPTSVETMGEWGSNDIGGRSGS